MLDTERFDIDILEYSWSEEDWLYNCGVCEAPLLFDQTDSPHIHRVAVSVAVSRVFSKTRMDIIPTTAHLHMCYRCSVLQINDRYDSRAETLIAVRRRTLEEKGLDPGELDLSMAILLAMSR